MNWTGIRRAVREASDEATKRAIKELTDEVTGGKSRTRLKKEIEDLTMERDRKLEEFERKEREIEHKVGLERKRQEFEVEQAKRETTVSLREENLQADRERFEGQMKFHEERFTEEVTYLKDMVSDVLKRLPSAEIYANISTGAKGK